VVLVTGGTGGIGSATCRALASAGFRPAIGYHRQVAEASALAHETGGVAVPLDLTDAAQITDAITTLVAAGAPLTGVVLNASPPPRPAPFGTITPEELHAQWTVNVRGHQQLIAEAVRHAFRAQRQGRVIGVLTSGMGHGIGTAASNLGAYLIAKFGLQGVLALAAADYPWLQVRAVAPHFTETAMLTAFDARYLEQRRAEQPFASPQTVAREILAHLTD
jgi:NAD(P)-dependent dehydrogenase (short-subunit alcohol dehydrogenase family)